MSTLELVRQEANARWQARSHGSQPVIYIGTASCGRAAGALDTLEAIRETLRDLGKEARIVEVGCIGPCYLEPLMDVALPGKPRVSYANVTPAKARKILTACLVEGDLLPGQAKGHFGEAEFTLQSGIQRFFDLPMLKPQVRIILKNCGVIDPEDFDSALSAGAYQGLERAFSIGPEGVIEELKVAGLRGRGGAGFPTYKKWEITRASTGRPKYVVCNADEGDPGAFMNRSLLEGDPHAVLEGILISGYTIGASEGIIYVRAEYPLAVERLRLAIGQIRGAGLLGKDILGSGFNFDIRIREGAGAFVCGEETALIASLEGQRGMPKPRPPFPADRGYKGKPTLINNTESFGTIPAILREGGAWFHQFGTSSNPGTKTFSLVGKVRYTGLIEVPLGMTLRQVVEEIGGGTPQPFKAIQTGGPLGGCLPAELLDTPITYETMRESGSIMGSGGLIVMDESTCMVDMARFFVSFARSESCGNCTPCRNGTRILSDTLERITRGEGEPEDLEILWRASTTMTKTSLCGLGQAAANPVMSSLKYFPKEYEAHIGAGFCQPAVCTELFEYSISADLCTGCGMCRKVCESDAIQGEHKQLHILDTTKCVKCKACVHACVYHAIIGAPLGTQANTFLLQEAE
jgi:NADH:ubiquinone oxidoreductase subunit F (NADH-binding)/NAD-dependent dihydropyrimidine dehydrogenase PreA subunit/(2Fe-2S) ferredoxin